MARDYSSRRNNPPGKNGQRKSNKRSAPAARPVRSKSKPKPRSSPRKKAAAGGRGGGGGRRQNSAPTLRSGAPGCIWLTCAILLCIVGLSIYYIVSRPAGHAGQSGHGQQTTHVDIPRNQSKTRDDGKGPKSARHADQAADDESHNHKPKYSFYKMLPNYKVEVPTGQRAPMPVTDNHAPHEAEAPKGIPKPGASNAPGSASHAGGDSKAPAAPAGGSSYVIQAGAFSKVESADRRKAKLTLLGVTAGVQNVRAASGKTIYRVQSEPIESRDKALALAQRLQSHGVETAVQRAR